MSGLSTEEKDAINAIADGVFADIERRRIAHEATPQYAEARRELSRAKMHQSINGDEVTKVPESDFEWIVGRGD